MLSEHDLKVRLAAFSPEPSESSIAELMRFAKAKAVDLGSTTDARLVDLHIASGCALGETDSTSVFHKKFADDIRRVGAKLFTDTALDDFVQTVFERLLVARAEHPPRICNYSGRGPLRSYVRMAASRVAIDLQRERGKQEEEAPKDLARQVAINMDPEQTLAKAEGHERWIEALRTAIAGLDSQERRALRYRYLLGFSGARMGALLGMHEMSVPRLLKRIRSKIANTVLRDARSFDALFARSLDISLERWLATSDVRSADTAASDGTNGVDGT